MICISPFFVRKTSMLVACGKCAFCTTNKISGWSLRCMHETATSSSAYWDTFTYANDHLPSDNGLRKADLKKFFKALRKQNDGLRYFAVGEYGENYDRPHYHALIWNLVDTSLLTQCWHYGFVHGSSVKGTVPVPYMLKYMYKPHPVEDKREKPFRLMSKGLGKTYIQKMMTHHKKQCSSVVYDFSTPHAMPRYYKDKIFNVHEKAILQHMAMDFLDRNPQQPCPIQHERLAQKLLKH